MSTQRVGLSTNAARLFGLAAASGLALAASVDVARAQCQFGEQAMLLSDDGEHLDAFGRSVSISGDTAVIGAYGDDDDGSQSGSAYIFVFNGSSWVQQAKLLPDDGEVGKNFGYSVAISGEIAVIGAVRDSTNGTYSGAAYVFVRDGSNWVQQAKLLPDDGEAIEEFGNSVAISGDTAVIGAWLDDDNGPSSGSAYVFAFDPDGSGSWVQQAKLLPDVGVVDAEFGYSVDLSGDTAVIGARNDVDDGVNSGSAYVYVFDGSNWTQQAKLVADDGIYSDSFGSSVAVSEDTILVGAEEDSGDNGFQSGSAYLFVGDGSSWVQHSKLLPNDGGFKGYFGQSATILGDTAVIGAKAADDFPAAGGAAYVFVFNGSGWVQQAKLMPDDDTEDNGFAYSVALYGETALVGARCDNSAFVFDLGDCNENAVLDGCDIAEGTSSDDNEDGIPDECEDTACEGDANGDGLVDPLDSGFVLARFGCDVGAGDPDCDIADMNGDGLVDPLDSGFVLARFGTCP